MSDPLACRDRLCRDPRRGRIAGVCAGLAEYLGIQVTVVRVIAVLSLLIWTIPTAAAYVIAAMVLPVRPATLYDSPEEEAFRHSMRGAPRDALARVRSRYRDLDRRIQALEAYITSRRFELDREFEQIRDAD